jgi:hypothetical protein
MRALYANVTPVLGRRETKKVCFGLDEEVQVSIGAHMSSWGAAAVGTAPGKTDYLSSLDQPATGNSEVVRMNQI